MEEVNMGTGTIVYYVSDSGFGHITRSLAIIKSIIKLSDLTVELVCGESQIEYARVFLHKYLERVNFTVLKTEVGTILKDNSFEFDVDATSLSIKNYLQTLPLLVEKEVQRLEKLNIALVITDITILATLVAKKIGVHVVAISNYTFYHRFRKIGIEESLIKPFYDNLNSVDCLYEFKYSDDMSEFTCPKETVGIVARRVNNLASSDFKHRYWPSAYISVGQVAKREAIKLDFPGGHVYATGKTQVEGNARILKLPARIGHSQDYISASSIAVIKPGWSQVVECLIAGIPFAVINFNPIEDGEIIEKLVAENRCLVVQEEELDNLDIKNLNIRAASLRNEKLANDVEDIATRFTKRAITTI
jgi:hypothetical protein